MDLISDVEILDLTSSIYLRPKNIFYSQEGKKKSSECILEHDDVVVLIFNSSRNVFIFVRQFRPAIYLHKSVVSHNNSKEIIDTDKYHGCLGVTIEMCSGIVDKNISLQEIAQAEVQEECGYNAPLQNFKHITNYRNASVLSGAMTTLYYVEVTDSMRVGPGGGLASEGEMIEVIEMTKEETKVLMMDESVNRDMALVLALQWFFYQNEIIY